MKKVNVLLNGKTLVDAQKLLLGKQVKICSNTCGHNYGAVGSKFPVECVNSWNGTSAQLRNAFGYINFTDIEIAFAATLEDLNLAIAENGKKIEELNSESIELGNKIKFMTDNNLTEFDEDVYKVSAVLNTLDNAGLSTLERSKIIANLIKN